MAKWAGKIGFVERVITATDVYSDEIVERSYRGDLVRLYRQIQQSGEKLNADLNISNDFSFVADDYARNHIQFMRYITWRGARWSISSIRYEHPRITITVGGLYNGPEIETECKAPCSAR